MYLCFFAEVSTKLKKWTIFDNFRIITQEGNMKTTQMIPLFHLLFLLFLLVTFISQFENTSNSISNSLLRSILVCKIPQFFSKSYWFGQLIILFQKVDTLRLLKIYIMFCLPAGAIYQFFQDLAHGLYWRLKKISYRTCLLFYYFFGDKKQLLRALLICTFIRLLLNFFDLRSYSSKSRRIYTFRLLCC